MKRQILLCIISLCVIILSFPMVSCGGNQTYVNDQYDFSCQYPSDWTLDDNYADTLVLFAKPVDSENDPHINVNIFIEELTTNQGISLEEYAEIREVQFQELDNYEKVAEQDISVSGIDAKLFVYSFDISTISIKGAQVFFIRNNIAYIITYTATPTSYNENYSEFKLIIDSFSFQ